MYPESPALFARIRSANFLARFDVQLVPGIALITYEIQTMSQSSWRQTSN